MELVVGCVAVHDHLLINFDHRKKVALTCSSRNQVEKIDWAFL